MRSSESTSAALPAATILPRSSSSSRSAYWPARLRSCIAEITVSSLVAAQRVDQLERLLLAAEVERARRLVEQQDRSVLGERARQHGALQLAAAERAEPSRGKRAQVEASDRSLGGETVGARLGGEIADVRRAAEQHVLGHGQLRRRLRVLRDERDLARDLAAAGARDGATVEQDLAGERDQAGEGAQDRRLARHRWGRSAPTHSPRSTVAETPCTTSRAAERHRHRTHVQTQRSRCHPPRRAAGRSRRTGRQRTR